MAVERIQGDGRTAEVRFCQRWLNAANELRDQLFEDGQGFDPFRYNETATVGFLVAAAGRANMLALPEFAENNRNLPKGRVRAGRRDLWLANRDWTINWVIEFKLNWFGQRSRRGLVTPLNGAIGNAFDRDRQEAGDRWGVRCLLSHGAMVRNWRERPAKLDLASDNRSACELGRPGVQIQRRGGPGLCSYEEGTLSRALSGKVHARC